MGVDRLAFQRLSRWFSNRAASLSKLKHAPISWFPLLQRLHQLRNPAPRRRSVVQQFMLEYPDEVERVFAKTHADDQLFSGAQKMNIRYELAKTLLHEDYPDLKDELQKKADDQYEASLGEWNLILDDISFAEDVSQCVLSLYFQPSLTPIWICRARDTFFDAVHPLLQAIGSYANCHVSLIAGSAGTDGEDDNFFTA
jgi:hypothetical protein